MAHILLPTDFSNASLKAVQFAFAHFGGARSRYTLVHAYLTPGTDDLLLPGFATMARKQAAKELLAFEKRCRKFTGTAVLARVTTKERLVYALNELKKNKRADLVVMGAHGAGDKDLVGTMATDVVKEAEMPVITVPKAWEPGPITRILLTHDGGPIDQPTLKPLLQLAKRKKAEIVVAHVRQNTYALDKAVPRAQVSRLLAGVPHSFVTVQGTDVASTIDELATKGRIQLVVSVHRKLGFWKGLLHTSKSKRMALHTHVPLMVLR